MSKKTETPEEKAERIRKIKEQRARIDVAKKAIACALYNTDDPVEDCSVNEEQMWANGNELLDDVMRQTIGITDDGPLGEFNHDELFVLYKQLYAKKLDVKCGTCQFGQRKDCRINPGKPIKRHFPHLETHCGEYVPDDTGFSNLDIQL